jgi:hypothetical protein
LQRLFIRYRTVVLEESNKNHIIELNKTLKQDREPTACSNVIKIQKKIGFTQQAPGGYMTLTKLRNWETMNL